MNKLTLSLDDFKGNLNKIIDNLNICQALTTRGKRCKNHVLSEEKITNNHNINKFYCKLHQNYYIYEKPSECSICMINLRNVHSPLSCGHYVHRECLYKWGKKICPICKQKLKLTKHELEQFALHRFPSNPIRDESVLANNIRHCIIPIFDSFLRDNSDIDDLDSLAFSLRTIGFIEVQ